PDHDTGATFEMSADYSVDFLSDLYDADNNRIDSGELVWIEINEASGDVRDITTELLLNNMRWDATEVGEWTIAAYSVSGTGFNISDSITITVYNGVAVVVDATLTESNPVAGQIVEIQVRGTDSDGNEFDQNVQWTEDGSPVATLSVLTTETGSYTYEAQIAGVHTLQYAAGGAVSTVEVTVEAQSTVARLEVNLTTDSLEQLESLEVTIRAFDAFDNEISVPSSIKVEATGRATTTMFASDQWTITTLDDGPQTITVSVGSVRVNSEITVIGNIEGFFEAGGTIYYVGAGLLGLVAIVLLGLAVMFFRSNGSDDWDDDDYDDDDEDEDSPRGPTSGPTGPAPGPSGPAPGPSGPAPGPSGPAPGPSGPAPVQEEVVEAEESSVEDDESYRVDEDGTAWWEDDEGTWWFRLEGEEDWQEWTE
ncbi:MAG: hypothetical protein ACPHQC_02230, partial [Poseidonia sp.]